MDEPPKTAVGAAITRLRDEMGFTIQQLADEVGMSKTAVADRESGKTRTKRSEWPRFCDALGVTLPQFEKLFRSFYTIDRPAYSTGIPLINMTPAGPTMDYEAWGEAGDEGYEYLDRGRVDDDMAFAIEVVGDSMTPTLREGDLVVLSPMRPHTDNDPSEWVGQVCFVRLSQDAESPGVFLARMAKTNDEEALFLKDNPRHAAVKVPWEHVERLAKLVEFRRSKAV